MRMSSIARAIVAMAAIAGASAPSTASATATFSGACAMSVEVTFTPTVVALPSSKAVQLGGTGTCIVNGDIAPMRLRGFLSTTSLTGGFSCAGGVVTGTGVVEIDTPGFSGPDVQLVVVEANGVISMTVVAVTHVLRFNGVAELAEDPVDAATCPTVGMASTTWVGAMPFQDPDPPPAV
jgi:hypothetical protein